MISIIYALNQGSNFDFLYSEKKILKYKVYILVFFMNELTASKNILFLYFHSQK